jgi:histidine kinase
MITLHDIELTDELHQSNHSIVFKGYEKKQQQQVVVKILKEDFPSSNLIAQFNEEYTITNKYEIIGIRKVLSKRKVNNKYVLILDYVEGVSLREYMQQHTLDIPTFLKLAIKITEVLIDIHQAGIIHKDLNPKNILITKDQHIKIIDFGVATSVKREVKQDVNIYVLEVTLAYISPEQTGRMNRSVDYRSDLYALGVTFYEMLTGRLPFVTEDALELVHAHIAKFAEPVHLVRREIPKALSDIISKLMAKNAESRYQSAYGLKMDLSNCLKQWQTKRSITLEKLGTNDICNIFHISEKLYGREKQISQLLNIYERACIGSKEMVLIGGRSGIGKTALVNEIHKPMTEKKGYFIRGKFEQFQRDLPYSAIIQALSDFASQILAEPANKVSLWKEEILKSVGSNGQVILDVLPKFELIIGQQPPVISLPPSESQNRFNFVFQQFIRDLCTEEHPIALFIDDWQWADMASLNLLKLLMTDNQSRYLLLIGAYRDNEVDAAHPFLLSVEDIKKMGGSIENITLQPLASEFVTTLIADTLHTNAEEVLSLAEIVQKKTNGSPFFVTQFLIELYEQNFLNFDIEQRCWLWDIEQIENLKSTDNVVELLVNKIQRLKPETQKVLQLGACIGNNFPLKVLANINDKGLKVTLDELREAVEEGIVLPLKGNMYAVEEHSIDADVYFKFLHDNVEQAAYSMITDTIRQETQLKLGRSLTEKNSHEYIEEFLFDITNYFNSARILITDPKEKFKVALLNLRAAQKAKSAAAYKSALQYLNTAEELLDKNIWQTHYETAYTLYKEKGECYFLIGDFQQAPIALSIALENAKNAMDKVEVLKIKMAQLSAQGLFHDGIRTVIQAVGLLGEHIPALEDAEGLQKATVDIIGEVMQKMTNRNIESIYDLPEVQDKAIRKIQELLVTSLDIVIMGVPDLIALFSGRIVNLVLEHGLTEMVAFGFSFWGVVMSGGFKKYADAYGYAALAFQLEQNKFPNKGIKSKLAALGGYSTAYAHHLRRCAEVEMEGYYAGLENGDMVYCCYCYAIGPRFIVLLDLEEARQIWEKALTFLQPLSFPSYCIGACSASFVQLLQQPFRQDQENSFLFQIGDFHENLIVEHNFAQTAPLIYALFKRYKLLLYIIYQEDGLALEIVQERQPLIAALGGLDPIFKADFHLFAAIAVVNVYQKATQEERLVYDEIIEESVTELQLLADVCEINFKAPLLAVKAVKAQVQGEILVAMDLFDEAIVAAQQYEIPQYEAVIAEAALRFYLARNKEEFAKVYLRKAHYAYQIWGAMGKVKQLEEKYAMMFTSITHKNTFKITTTNPHATIPTKTSHMRTQTRNGVNNLDFQSILKATQAISGEIQLNKLLEKMIILVMENAGAERGVLLQYNHLGQLVVNAEYNAATDQHSILQGTMLEKAHLPLSIIRYVERTKETLVLNEANKDHRFRQDDYVVKEQAKSICCLPIMIQGKMSALLYLDNNLASYAFDEQRMQVMNMLSGQIAVSIENAILYNSMEQKVQERTKQLNDKNEELGEKNKRITDSMRYALSIQSAILPLPSTMQQLFPQHFVIYLPKDIVSGDFYWVSEIDNKKFIAVVDCTGHGVPGAFMSMLGNSLLNQIVNEKFIFSPADILTNLHKGINHVLKQEETENRDGMDVAICQLQSKDQQTELTFAGAKRPLFYYQNQQLHEQKGDRYAIGGMVQNNLAIRDYQDHVLLLDKGNVIYLFSDGLTDQANHQRNKFSLLQLRALLQQYGSYDIALQEEILINAWEEFKQTTEQRDDVTMVAIQL